MLSNLTDYNLINICTYLNNADSYSFILVSKHLKMLFYKEGFLKHIKFGYNIINTDIHNFSILCATHHKTLQSISISNTHNPQNWIPIIWPKIVYFNLCNITDKIDPVFTNTEELHILHHEIINNRNLKMKINWSKFPKLKILRMNIFDIDLSKIKECKKLKYININIFNKDSIILKIDINNIELYMS